MRIALLSALAIALSACASTSVVPVGDNTFRIRTSAAPVCGHAGAAKVALRQAAIETIKNGGDRFRILDGRYSAQQFNAGYTPVTAHTTHTGNIAGGTYYGNSHTTYSGGAPITMTRHNQGYIVRVFKPGQPGYDGAVSARQVLGPKWQEVVKTPNATCIDAD